MHDLERRRWAPWTNGGGAALLVGAVLVGVVLTPALARFPDHLDQTARYTGSFSLLVDQKTLAPLASPLTVPLQVERRVQVRAASFSTVRVSEDVTMAAGPLTMHQHDQYVMDRRTMALQADPRTELFGQQQTVPAAAGTYRINWPLGTSASGTYRSFMPETATAAVLRHGRGPAPLAGTGLQAVTFTSTTTDTPVSAQYRAWLGRNGFPLQLTPTQLLPRLAALGVDVPQVLAAITPQLTPAEQAAVDRALTQPIPLRYSYSNAGTVAIEPDTGALLHVTTTSEVVSVSPDLSGLAALQPVLQRFAAVPSVQGLANALDELASAPPQPVTRDHWTQTAASTDAAAATATTQLHQLSLLGTLPWAVGGAGVVLVAAGPLSTWRRRHHSRHDGGVGPGPASTGPGSSPAAGGPATTPTPTASGARR